MSDKDVELKIGADGKQADQEFDKVASSAEKAGKRIQETMREASYNMAASTKAAADGMKEHFGKVAESFEKVNVVLAAFTAVLAGGAVFKEGIEESNKLTMEAVKLGKQLGISATEAGVLSVALGDVYVDADTMVAVNQKLVKSLGTNELAFKSLGVATRDQNGHFRDSLDIMLDVNTKLLTFKEGVDRNIEGQKIYGKQWGEMQGILKLTTERMEDARKKSEDLGLIIGKENVEATANYRAAMNDVGDVLSAIKKSIGDALLPILTELGNWFANIGPATVTVIKGAIQLFAEVVKGLMQLVAQLGALVGDVLGSIGGTIKAAFGGESLSGMELFINMIKVVRIAIASLASGFAQLVEGVRGSMVAFSRAIVGNLSGADAALQESADRLAKMREDYKNTVEDIAMGGKATPTTSKEGGAHSEGGEQKDGKSQVTDWKAELEARKEVEGEFFKDSLGKDEAFWQSKLGLVRKGSKDEIAIRHELFAIHKQLAQQNFAAELETLKNEQDAARAGSAERVNLATVTAMHIGDTYGYESKEYLAALKDIRKAADDFNKEQEKLEAMKLDRARDHSLAMIGMERDQLGLKKSLGEVDDQEEIAELIKLKNREYQIESQALRDKIALMQQETPEKQQQLDTLAKMQDKHNAEIGQLNIKSVQAVQKNWLDMLGAINSAFDKSITGVIMGTQKVHDAVAQIGQSILAEFVNLGVKRTTAWIANEVAMLAANRAKNIAVASMEKTSASTSVTSSAATATAVVGAEGAKGAAGAASSQAAIPIIGPGLAIGAFAATMALILGARSLIHSSAGGEWQVPTDRLNLVHKNETILPAHIAGPLRDMVANGGSMGGGHTINISAVDAAGVKKLFDTHGASIVASLRKQQRSFNGA